MAGLFGLSVTPGAHRDDFKSDLFWGTFYHQHLGERSAGFSTNNGRINIRTCLGHLRSSFDDNLDIFGEPEGIGCCGLSHQPFRFGSKFGIMSLAITGNIINHQELIRELESQPGQTFERGDEVEVVAKLIASGQNIIDGLRIVTQKIKGAITLLLLTQEGLYAFYGPDGHWPLVLGEKDEALVVASESGGFNNLGFQIKRDLAPGEIVFLQRGAISSCQNIIAKDPKICSFLWVYTNFVSSTIRGIPSSRVRMKLGAFLAKRDIEAGFIPHIVFPIPDSGRFHALGYYWEFCRQMMLGRIKRIPIYFELLVKYPHTGRSFTPDTKEKRDREARAKILGVGEEDSSFLQYFAGLETAIELAKIEDIDAVGCDDSVVRGTQLLGNFIPKLRQIGIKRIHIRAANPELLCHCRWGKTTKRGEVIASQIPDLQERAKYLGLISLDYNTVNELVEAIGLPKEQLCIDCDLFE